MQSVSEAVTLGLRALQDLGLPIDDRDRMRAKDMINTATFEHPNDSPGDREICMRQFLQQNGHRDSSMDSRLGKLAKKLLLQENPGFCFPKKQIYVNGQMLEANVWRESQRKYLEQALSELRTKRSQTPGDTRALELFWSR